MLIVENCRLIGLTGLVAAAALPALGAMPGAPSLIATRSPEAIERDFGRAGGDAYWADQELVAPPGPVVKAYEAADNGAIKSQEQVKDVAMQPRQSEPERYGRAGGFVGMDVINAPIWSGAHASPIGAQPAADWYGRAGTPSLFERGGG